MHVYKRSHFDLFKMAPKFDEFWHERMLFYFSSFRKDCGF